MKSIPKLIRRFLLILLLSTVLLLFLNIAALVLISANQTPGASPWTTAKEAAAALRKTENGYQLSKEMSQELRSENAWALFVDNRTLKVLWTSEDLPDAVPLDYDASDIAYLTRGYIADYPTFTGESDDGLMVLGYPKDRFWKQMYPAWDYDFIADLPKTLLTVFAANAVLLLLIYVVASSRLLRSVNPIAEGIQLLPDGQPVHVKETGALSQLARSINETSYVLQRQKYDLEKKETARANWIAGVSHDIRTPLSMVMGYASQLESSDDLPENQRQKAMVIRGQSEKIRSLVSDLNLASKLEYNMQPVNLRQEHLVPLMRKVVVDFMNMDIENRHPIVWDASEAAQTCVIHADRDLLQRAISNLIQNSINHNAAGCQISVSIITAQGKCRILVEDNGIGVSSEQLEKLNHAPHYMICDTNGIEQRHGLGLLLVKQIIAAHQGEIRMGRSANGGFSVELTLPCS